jgi:hypothetical protein
VRWINDADPSLSENPRTLEGANEERTVYLIDDAAGGDPENLERWLKRDYANLFAMELEDWYTDTALLPPVRNYRLFREWFDPECHTVVIDAFPSDLIDEDV